MKSRIPQPATTARAILIGASEQLKLTSNLTIGISYLPLTAAQTKILNSSLGGQTKVSKSFNECRQMHISRPTIYLQL